MLSKIRHDGAREGGSIHPVPCIGCDEVDAELAGLHELADVRRSRSEAPAELFLERGFLGGIRNFETVSIVEI